MLKRKFSLGVILTMALAVFAFVSPVSATEVTGFIAPQTAVEIVLMPEMVATPTAEAAETYGGLKSTDNYFMLVFVALLGIMAFAAIRKLEAAKRLATVTGLFFESIKSKIIGPVEIGWRNSPQLS